MACGQALISLFLLAPCEAGGGPEAIQAALSSAARPETDIARDANRKPDEVLGFFDITPGMTVLEVFSGGGYYTQILDGVVGSDGKLLAHNNQAYLQYVGTQFHPRFENGGLPNTKQLIDEANNLSFESNSLDAAVMILAYHDFLFGDESFGWPDVDETQFIETLCDAIRPGGVLGFVDHVADPGGDPAQVAQGIHRIDPALVKAEFANSCFELEAESFILRNPEDDHTSNAIQGPMAGQTDRFVYKFVRK